MSTHATVGPVGPAPVDTALLRVEHVHVRFGPTAALTDASYHVEPGEVVALVGRSGSGKSTLLHCSAGLLVPQEGVVRYGEQDLRALTESQRTGLRRDHFGFVFQFGSLVPELTARENVALPLRLQGSGAGAARQEAEAWLDRLGVAEVADKQPAAMSGGQSQRVAVARALITGPALVFADEPTGALDSANSDLVADALLGAAREQGSAVVLVTHDGRVAALADRQLTVSDGRVEPGGGR